MLKLYIVQKTREEENMISNALNTNHTIAHVVVSRRMNDILDYIIPEHLQPLTPGTRVKIKLGNSTALGLVINTSSSSTIALSRLKPIVAAIDNKALWVPEQMDLLRFAAKYYHTPIGTVLNKTLPKHEPNSYQGASIKPEINEIIITALGQSQGTTDNKLGKKQQQVLQNLIQNGPQNSEIIKKQCTKISLNKLEEKGYIKTQVIPNQTIYNQNINNTTNNTINNKANNLIKLNDEQQAAVNHIIKKQNTHQSFLLDGVTGSGKTEVYITAIQNILAQSTNGQALIMVPEIGLTPQTTKRFEQHFGNNVVTWHSKLSTKDRKITFDKLAQNQARIIISTRSGLFLPFADLKIIVVDEEHDSSFKSHDGFRYCARNLAQVLAKNLNIPIILGSATPSLETFHAVSQNRCKHLILNKRAISKNKVNIKIVDLHQHPATEGFSNLATTFIKKHLDSNNQVMVFLNRRGYAPVLMCPSCRWLAECPNCSSHLTWHKKVQLLKCHHCGYENRIPKKCPSCNHNSFVHVGMGTERIEQTLSEKFDSPVIRLDRDTITTANKLEKTLQPVQAGKPCIIIGTQMLAKGHDFPKLSGVIILDADSGLLQTDFRNTEHMAQLLTQVIGRVGRAETPGEVLIQTTQPEHPLLTELIPNLNYREYAKTLTLFREKLQLPPFGYLALLSAEAKDLNTAIQELNSLKTSLETQDYLKETINWVQILGPSPASMEKRQGLYRAQILFKSSRRAPLHQILNEIQRCIQHKSHRHINMILDVDPIHLHN